MEIPFTLIGPVMNAHGVTYEEAEKRLQLLQKSNILSTGSPNDPETQRLIDNFLAQDSTVLEETVAFEKFFNSCLSDRKMVKEYDRLSGTKLFKLLGMANQGMKPKSLFDELAKFEAFVRETLWPAFLNSQPAE